MRGTEEHKLWLFDLAHGNLNREQTVKGFIRFYVLSGRTMENVQDDILFHTVYDPREAMERLKAALEEAADG